MLSAHCLNLQTKNVVWVFMQATVSEEMQEFVYPYSHAFWGEILILLM